MTAVLSCGWLQVRDPMTGSLREIDECALLPGICRHGRCLNTVGSFTCDCDPGYRCDFHIRASNEPSRILKYNHDEGPYYGLHLVESGYYRYHI